MTPQAAEELTLAAVPSAVRCSRMFVRLHLRRWGLPSLAEDSELVISELVTNAVQATGVTETKPLWSQLAARWDYLPVQDGKCVWAELAIQLDALASVKLPRRPHGSPTTLVPEPGVDLDLLRRVRQALKDI